MTSSTNSSPPPPFDRDQTFDTICTALRRAKSDALFAMTPLIPANRVLVESLIKDTHFELVKKLGRELYSLQEPSYYSASSDTKNEAIEQQSEDSPNNECKVIETVSDANSCGSDEIQLLKELTVNVDDQHLPNDDLVTIDELMSEVGDHSDNQKDGNMDIIEDISSQSSSSNWIIEVIENPQNKIPSTSSPKSTPKNQFKSAEPVQQKQASGKLSKLKSRSAKKKSPTSKGQTTLSAMKWFLR